MCVTLRATLSHKIFNSEKYEHSRNSPTIIESLWRGNDGFVIFRMDVKKYMISSKLGDRVQPEQVTQYVFEHPPYCPTSPRLIFIVFRVEKQTGWNAVSVQRRSGKLVLQLLSEIGLGVLCARYK